MTGAAASPPRRTVSAIAPVLRRARIARSRLVASGGLVAAGIAVRGAGGVLLAMVAGIVLLDAVVPMPTGRPGEADERFRRLVRARRRHARLQRLRGRPVEALDVVDAGAGALAHAERRALGVQVIPVASVTGTVEHVKARAFDRRFRPDRASAERWTRLWLAHAHGAALPPISVYRLGGAHIVCDGHHRVSVARDHGLETIEAHVVELRPAR
jgi:hypothetical protein